MSILISNCGNSEISEPVDLIHYSFEQSNEFQISDAHIVSVENYKGGIIVYGNDDTNKISYTLNKTVRTANREQANMHFDEIEFIKEMNFDTVYCSVAYPYDSDYLQSYGYLDLYIPYTLPLLIQNATEGIYVSYMSSDIIIRDVKDHISITHHSGTCDVSTLSGKIQIELILPDSGFCHAETEEGDIILKIPHTSSATIDARTDFGTISHTGLTIKESYENYGALRGIIGSGRCEIWLRTKIGDIEIFGM
jgi:hypothetical protein